MAYIKIYTAIVLVVLASAISGHIIPRLSDHSYAGAKFIKLSLTKEENTKEYLQPKQFGVSPTANQNTLEIEEDISVNSSEESKRNKRYNSDDAISEVNEDENDNEVIENAGDVEPETSESLTQLDNDVEENKESKKQNDQNVTINHDDAAESDIDDQEDNGENNIYEENAVITNKKRQSGDEPIDDNDETNDINIENAIQGETEKQDVERKEIKRQNNDENEGWEGSGEDLDDNSESAVAE